VQGKFDATTEGGEGAVVDVRVSIENRHGYGEEVSGKEQGSERVVILIVDAPFW
jgi:hypothetical protein